MEGLNNYDKILSLDFEMYNSMRYWSICWIGAAVAGADLRPTEFIDIKVNPGTSRKMIGKGMSFPFTYSELKKMPGFAACSPRLFSHIDGRTLVLGHAIDNDVKMLLAACAHCGIECPDFDYLDTNAVYGAIKGEYAQVGLATLAENYGITFSAHNPVEDARATLASLKCMLENGSLTLSEVIEKYGITLGKVRKGQVRKITLSCMHGNTLEHINNFNSVFDASIARVEKRSTLLENKKIAFDGKLRTSQNLYDFTLWLRSLGAETVFDSEKADFTIGSELRFGDSRYMCLRDFAKKYGIPKEVASTLNFFINKVVERDGTIYTYMQYLRLKYGSNQSGKVYCLSRGIERRLDLEDVAASLLKKGAKAGCTFIVESENELNDMEDIKVRSYRACKKSGKISLEVL